MGTTEDTSLNKVKFYDLINDPNTEVSICSPFPVFRAEAHQGVNKTVWTWKDKVLNTDHGAEYIFRDIKTLFHVLVRVTSGLVDCESSFVLVLSQTSEPFLKTKNAFDLTVQELLSKIFPNLTVVIVPELSVNGQECLYMFCPELLDEFNVLVGMSCI